MKTLTTAALVAAVLIQWAGCKGEEMSGGQPCSLAVPGACQLQTLFCGADSKCQPCVPGTLNCNGINLDYCEVQATACGQPPPPPVTADSGDRPCTHCAGCCDDGVCQPPNARCSNGGICQNGACLMTSACTGCVNPNCCDNGICQTQGQTCTNGQPCQNGTCSIPDGY